MSQSPSDREHELGRAVLISAGRGQVQDINDGPCRGRHQAEMGAVPKHVGMSIGPSAGIVSRASKSRERLLNGLRRLRRELPEGLGAVGRGHDPEALRRAHDHKTIKSPRRPRPTTAGSSARDG
jgi:hypothetical protein